MVPWGVLWLFCCVSERISRAEESTEDDKQDDEWTKHFSYEERLKQRGLFILEKDGQRGNMAEMYKIVLGVENCTEMFSLLLPL